MKQKSLFFLSLFILIVFPLSAMAENGWAESKKAEGITVYVKKSGQSAIKTFKGEMLVKNRLTPLIAALSDTNNYPKLLHDCKFAKKVKTVSDTEFFQYIITDMPWPVKDRDFIIHSVLEQNPTNKRVTITSNTSPSFMKEKAGLVRIKNIKVRWLLTPDNAGNVKVLYEVSVDPAGNIPKWLVNTLAVDVPFYTLKNLRSRVKNNNYQTAKLNYIND